MTDVFSPAFRSLLMSRIGGKNTRPELLVRKLLHALGYRFRLHCKNLPGTPDIVLPRWKIAIFVHGCFWHQHPGCKRATVPNTNRAFWENKLMTNRRRDARRIVELEELGYRCLVIWECETRDSAQLAERLAAFLPIRTAS